MLNNTGWMMSLLWLRLCTILEPRASARSSFYMQA